MKYTARFLFYSIGDEDRYEYPLHDLLAKQNITMDEWSKLNDDEKKAVMSKLLDSWVDWFIVRWGLIEDENGKVIAEFKGANK